MVRPGLLFVLDHIKYSRLADDEEETCQGQQMKRKRERERDASDVHLHGDLTRKKHGRAQVSRSFFSSPVHQGLSKDSTKETGRKSRWPILCIRLTDVVSCSSQEVAKNASEQLCSKASLLCQIQAGLDWPGQGD